MAEGLASLDPLDWDAFEELLVEQARRVIADLRRVGMGPVWRPVPDELKARLAAPAPRRGETLDKLAEEIAGFMAYGVGNRHPRFFGWVHGAGTPAALVADLYASALNANCGGRDHVATYVERQVVGWFRELFGLPVSTGGLLLSGTSMATLVALALAREAATRGSAARDGLAAHPELTVYASEGAHSSVRKAVELLGLGRRAVRALPLDGSGAMRAPDLDDAIAQDVASGRVPMAVVATAGTASIGAIDPLRAIADVAKARGVWIHVDGAFGALVRLAPDLAPLVDGIERADSIAFDCHKWLHVPYDAGCLLARRGAALPELFSTHADYLEAGPALAGGAPWFGDLGPELSRGFRALKVWLALRHFGLDRLGQAIAGTCALARHLGRRIESKDGLRLLAPVALNIVCFRVESPGLAEPALDRLNRDIVVALQLKGLAAPSTTRIGGRLAIRAAILNHRTTQEDIDGFLADTLTTAQDLMPRFT